MNTLSRRSFLATTSAAAVGATASAIEPFPRSGKPRLQLSLAAYSVREFFTDGARPAAKAPPADKAMDMFKFVDYCAAHGCEGAELTS
ncbi:MAG: twin-arginine translocation signal domain-containing protein, partial [Verrucomicrobia bacterium]|nr:twin-arginine translocation signal domain-containing protein [Verrucomicrobiota bacterium]